MSTTSYQNVVILLPGTTGSTLVLDPSKYNSSTPVWPTIVSGYAAAGNLSDAQNSMESDLFPGKPIMNIYDSTSKQLKDFAYKIMIGYFQADGYDYWVRDKVQTSVTGNENLLISFPYDWRNGNYETAQNELIPFLDKLTSGGFNNSNIREGGQLILLGHSMGGLVMRNLIDALGYSTNSTLKLITMGTPHLGAPLALSGMTGEFTKLSQTQTGDFIGQFSNYPTMVSTAELLPTPQKQFDVISQGTNNYSNYAGVFYQALPSWGVTAANVDNAKNAWSKIAASDPSKYTLIYAINNDGSSGTVSSFSWSGKLGAAGQPMPQTTKNSNDGNGNVNGGDSVVPWQSATFGLSSVGGNIYMAKNPTEHDWIPAQKDVYDFIQKVINGH